MNLNGRRALVTGGARRIGRALSLDLAAAGAHVAIHYNASEKEAREVEAACPSGVALQADLSDAAAAEGLVREAHERLGGLDILINSAGIWEATPLGEIDEAAWDRHLDLNAKGAFFCAQAAGLLMRKAGEGVIVNITDWAALRPYPAYLPYFAAKAALMSVTVGLARALAPEVRVNAVAPGAILLPEAAGEERAAEVAEATLLGRLGGTEAVVGAVRFLIENDFMTGQILTVDGGRSLR
ncbi:MAG: SDR family oxidoreductase [Planctomycetota bacterium]|nr:SDR family oxidoreductase [Planctomycetota bacterium]